MENLIVAGIVLIILGAAIIYIYKEKKRGVKCIGCPAAEACASRNSGVAECSCGCQSE